MNKDEKLVEGTFTGHIEPGDSILISVDRGWADAMDVSLGDELVWDVQGALITTYIGSMREIECRSMGTRFFVLFPTGVLEKAPQFHVLLPRSTTETFGKVLTTALRYLAVVMASGDFVTNT